MTEKTIDQIKSEIAALKKEGDSTATVLTQSPAILPQKEQSIYDDSFLLSCTVIGFGVFVLICITYLIRRDKQIETLLRPFGTILIIIAAVFLIVAGYSEKQIAPVIGLLGTIAGYILGRDGAGKSKDETVGK
jgi:hypothetical protein